MISPKTRRIMEDMVLRTETPKLTDEKLDSLIEWARSENPDIPRRDLLTALIDLRLRRTL